MTWIFLITTIPEGTGTIAGIAGAIALVMGGLKWIPEAVGKWTDGKKVKLAEAEKRCEELEAKLTAEKLSKEPLEQRIIELEKRCSKYDITLEMQKMKLETIIPMLMNLNVDDEKTLQLLSLFGIDTKNTDDLNITPSKT